MSEHNLWELMRDRMGNRWHASRVESRLTSAGIPDINYCIQGHESHIELKYSDDGSAPKVRSTQTNWFRDRVKAGGRPWVFSLIEVGDRKMYMLHKGDDMTRLARSKSTIEWANMSYCLWHGAMDWDEFTIIIRRRW